MAGWFESQGIDGYQMREPRIVSSSTGGSYLDQLQAEAARLGVSPDASWADDLSRTYQGANGAGARTEHDIFTDLMAQQAARAASNGGGGAMTGSIGAGGSGGTFQAASPMNQMQYGGGNYPLASVSGDGLMAPFAASFQRPDWETFSQNPAYQFRLQQGQEALERSAAARGTLLTGGTLKDLAAFSQGLASQEYDKEYDRELGLYDRAQDTFFGNSDRQFNRLASLGGLGQTAAGQVGQYGSQYGQNANDLITGAGNAQAAGQVGSANAWSGALGNLGNLAMQYAWMNRV